MNQALLLSYTVGSLLGPSFAAMLMQNYSDNLLFIMIASVSFIYLLMLLRNAARRLILSPTSDCSLNRMQDVSLAYSLFMFYVK